MPKITFIQADGNASEVNAISGDSVMETAIDNDIAGIVAECGGACSCATCHVYVADDWLANEYRKAAQAIDAQLLVDHPTLAGGAR